MTEFLSSHKSIKLIKITLQKQSLKQKKPDKKSFAFFVKLFLSGLDTTIYNAFKIQSMKPDKKCKQKPDRSGFCQAVFVSNLSISFLSVSCF